MLRSKLLFGTPNSHLTTVSYTLKVLQQLWLHSEALQTHTACWKPRKHNYHVLKPLTTHRYYSYRLLHTCMATGYNACRYFWDFTTFLYRAVITPHRTTLSVTTNVRGVIMLHFVRLHGTVNLTFICNAQECNLQWRVCMITREKWSWMQRGGD